MRWLLLTFLCVITIQLTIFAAASSETAETEFQEWAPKDQDLQLTEDKPHGRSGKSKKSLKPPAFVKKADNVIHQFVKIVAKKIKKGSKKAKKFINKMSKQMAKAEMSKAEKKASKALKKKKAERAFKKFLKKIVGRAKMVVKQAKRFTKKVIQKAKKRGKQTKSGGHRAKKAFKKLLRKLANKSKTVHDEAKVYLKKVVKKAKFRRMVAEKAFKKYIGLLTKKVDKSARDVKKFMDRKFNRRRR